MKIVIVGDQQRADTWEQLFRKLPEISEVIFTNEILADPTVDGVLLIDDSEHALSRLLQSVKNGHHTYFISRLFYHTERLEEIYRASEEAGVQVQFSHWPTLSESVQWIKKRMPNPSHIMIRKDSVQASRKVIDIEDFNHEWMDEISLITGITGGQVHKSIIRPVLLKNWITGFSATLLFESSTVVSFHFSGIASQKFHQRIFSDHHSLLDFDALAQQVHSINLNSLNRMTRTVEAFHSAETAKNSLNAFIRSAKENTRPVFSPYEAISASKVIDLISRSLYG